MKTTNQGLWTSRDHTQTYQSQTAEKECFEGRFSKEKQGIIPLFFFFFFFFFMMILVFEFRAYTLSHSTSLFCDGFYLR
jgi:hypothetical protein